MWLDKRKSRQRKDNLVTPSTIVDHHSSNSNNSNHYKNHYKKEELELLEHGDDDVFGTPSKLSMKKQCIIIPNNHHPRCISRLYDVVVCARRKKSQSMVFVGVVMLLLLLSLLLMILIIVIFVSISSSSSSSSSSSISLYNSNKNKQDDSIASNHESFPSVKSYEFDLSDYLVEEMPKPFSFEDMLEMHQRTTTTVNGSGAQNKIQLPDAVVTVTSQSEGKGALSSAVSEFNIVSRRPSPEILLRYGPTNQLFAVSTRRGFKRQAYDEMERVPNQDSAIVWNSSTSRNKKLRSKDFLVGIFDGHGSDGHITSQFVADEIPYRLGLENRSGIVTPKSSEQDIVQALIKTFEDVNSDVNNGILRTDNMSGTTASLILRLGNKLYGANAGDSRTFICSILPIAGTAKVLYINREDKPDLPGEKERIDRSKNGKVVPPQMPNDSSRVVVQNWNILDGFGMPSIQALAMSRSVGEGKVFQDAGVIATPIVQVLNIEKFLEEEEGKNVKLFAIAASDGLLGYVTPDQVAHELAQILYTGSQIINLQQFCEQLILLASQRWKGNYRDDISIAIHQIIE